MLLINFFFQWHKSLVDTHVLQGYQRIQSQVFLCSDTAPLLMGSMAQVGRPTHLDLLAVT